MSNYWDLQCVPCDVLAGFHWNHGEDRLAQLLLSLTELTNLARLMRTLPMGMDITVSCDFTGNVPNMEFFLEHEGHQIVVLSEYGYRYGDCNKRIGNTFTECRLDKGHSDECSPVRR